MNICDDVQNRLSAYLDHELSEEEAGTVRAHLETCSQCAKHWEQLRRCDQMLKDQLGPMATAAMSRGLKALGAETEGASTGSTEGAKLVSRDVQDFSEPVTPVGNIPVQRDSDNELPETVPPSKVNAKQHGSVSQRSIWMLLLAAAAAVLVFWNLPETPVPVEDDGPSLAGNLTVGTPIAATLVRATGPVQVLPPGEIDWITVDADSQHPVPIGARVKTDAVVRCEFTTSSDATVRMDSACEVVVDDSKKIDLVQGKLWCSVPVDETLEVKLPVAADKGETKLATFLCPSQSTISCGVAEPDGCVAAWSCVDDSIRTELRSGEKRWQVGSGERVCISGGEEVNREAGVDGREVWQLPLLSLSDATRDELVLFTQQLLSPVGRTKAAHLNEQQIRALGPAGAIPLLAYVTYENNLGNRELRRTAMRLATTTADVSAVRLLKGLVGDPDEVIAAGAEATLERLGELGPTG